MRICRDIGGMTLEEMMRRMSAAEYTLWCAEYELEAAERAKHA